MSKRFLWFSFWFLGLIGASAQDEAINLSLRLEVEHAIDRGIAYLKTQKNEDGYWGEEKYPAVTAMVLTAMAGDPVRKEGEAMPEDTEEAFAWLISNQKRDGGIYGKGLQTYNTALAIKALVWSQNPEVTPVLEKARKFLVNQQSDFDRRGKDDTPFDGGIGYGGSYAHSDLSNTHLALEALSLTKNLIADKPKEEVFELNWESALAFVSRCQNLEETNGEDWASNNAEDKGGFVYFPGSSKAGERTLEAGTVALRSYGSMSYAGLLSFIYADMSKEDARIKTVKEWLQKHYSIEENPGMGLEGLYYYYHTMAKALTLAEMDTIDRGGNRVDWRKDLAKKLFNLQKTDGSWLNENGRWWEGDPVMVTAYAVMTLEYIHRGL